MAEAVAVVVPTEAARAADFPAVGDTEVAVEVIAVVEDTPAVRYIAVEDIAVATDTATAAAMDIAVATDIAAATDTPTTATVDIPIGEVGDMPRITQATTMVPITTPTIPTRHIPRPTSPSTHPSAAGLHRPDTLTEVILL